MASANTISVAPVKDGWVVMLTDGRELARFTGPDAKRNALRYAASANPVRRHPTDRHRAPCAREARWVATRAKPELNSSIGGPHARNARII